MEKIPIGEITKELKSLGMSEEAIKDLLQVLSIKSLTKLEGWLLLHLDREVPLIYFGQACNYFLI